MEERGRKGESDKGQEKERQEGRADGEKERKDDRKKKRGEPDGLSGACSSRGFAQQQRKYSVQSVWACVSELSEGKGPELEPGEASCQLEPRQLPVLLAFTPSLFKMSRWSTPWGCLLTDHRTTPRKGLEPEEPHSGPLGPLPQGAQAPGL